MKLGNVFKHDVRIINKCSFQFRIIYKCIKNSTNCRIFFSDLYHTCTKDYECKGYDTFSILECKKNECVCKEGTCSKG